MPSTAISSTEFARSLSRARKIAESGPVVITERGKEAYVLLTIEEYSKIVGIDQNMVGLLAMSEAARIES
jgi:prevent-host-death family protein